MAVKLKPSSSPPASPFSWEIPPGTPQPTEQAEPPTSWLSARDMKVFGAEPLGHEVGIIKCKDCSKAILRSAIPEHADNCSKVRALDKKNAKGKPEVEDPSKKGKKRKADDEPEDANAPKPKKQARTRVKGPVDYDKQCGVINDKNLPCSRSLTCKSHSMGAKRAVLGRSKAYDELLLDWNRLNNPNWVEPVKKESKAERKERKEKEKADKKRQAQEAAAAAGADASKKGVAGAFTGGASKKSKKGGAAAAAAAAAVSSAAQIGVHGDDALENLDDLDSDAELDSLVKAVRTAQGHGLIGIPLASPCDASSWFVARRERLRNCNQLLANTLNPARNAAVAVGVRLG